MAEDRAPAKATRKFPGWVKAAATSATGVVSGALLMYLTPLLNSVIKPGRPIANFAHQTSGLTVTINNRSVGAAQGWWDFGDGSALEPFDPGQDVVTHAYPRGGSYSIKLAVENALGEASERSVGLTLDGAAPAASPVIEAFEVVPLQRAAVAPATFRIVSKVTGADLVVWGFGDEPLKPEAMREPEKYVTLSEPGYYTLRLVAFQGKQAVERQQTVWVDAGDDKPMATLQVFHDGIDVRRRKTTLPLALQWDAKQQGSVCPVSREFAVERGWQVHEAALPQRAPDLRNAKLEIAPDKTRLRLSGELVKPKHFLMAKTMAAPQTVVQVEATLEKRSPPMSRPGDVLSYELNIPGTTLVPLPPPPPTMEVQSTRIALALKDGKQTLWNGPGLPTAAQVALRGRMIRITATDLGTQLRIDVVDAARPR